MIGLSHGDEYRHGRSVRVGCTALPPTVCLPVNAPRDPRAFLALLLRSYSMSIGRTSMPWYLRLLSAFAGAAVFAGIAVLLAEEKLYRRWTRDQDASDSAALLSQADTIVAGGLAFALTIILTLVLIIAVVVSVSFKNGAPLHLFLMGFGLFCLFAFAVNVAVNVPGAVLG